MSTATATPTPAGIGAWLNVNIGLWRLASLMVAAVVAAPLLVLAMAWLTPDTEVWRHLSDTLLLGLVRNTLVLLVSVGSGVLLLGVGLAWLTAMCDFPGRNFFDWALMLPLAVPAYVLAFVAVGVLDFSGPVQSVLRQWLGTSVWFPPIRSEGGVIAVMVLAFYPYVYMLARSAFLNQGHHMLETARVLGLNAWAAFFRVTVPVARPAIAAGVALALMETLADFGAVSVFNYDTFTTAIYKAWFGFFSLGAAAQLAMLLLLFIATAVYAEQRLRGGSRYHVNLNTGEILRYRLKGTRALAAVCAASVVLLLAFVLPVSQLALWAWGVIGEELDARYLSFFGNTLFLGAIAAVLTTVAALLLSYTHRLKPDPITQVAVRISTLGYALPGSVLAVGVMMSFVWVDQHINSAIQWLTGEAWGAVLTGSVFSLLLAYVVRFMAVAYGPVDSAFDRIKPSILQVARCLGAGNMEILRRLSIPMLRTGLLSALLLVFVEVMKEMPATLLLRPFGWTTLATRIFEMTSEGEWERAALPAVTLVLAGLLPVVLIVRRSAK
ncbi:MAG TPA: iron ABC transporter permease [Acidiferrobacteraceae bacterium]|nr:iron ABC transporter permease [Acidiferrobacteraceae bacterium]